MVCEYNFGCAHEDFDQLFAMICQYGIRRHRWQLPEEFHGLVRETLSDTISVKDEVLVVQGLRCVRDYSARLEPQRVEFARLMGQPRWL